MRKLLLPVAVLALSSCTSVNIKTIGDIPPSNLTDRTITIAPSTKDEIILFSKLDSSNYLVGPGDILRINSQNNDLPKADLKVSPDGKVVIDKLGEFVFAGKEVNQIAQEINEKIKKGYIYSECSLSLVSAINKKITILGDVKNPGVIVLDSDISLIEGIAKTGGFASSIDGFTDYSKVEILCKVIRDNGKSIWIDLSQLLFKGEDKLNIKLKNNDIVFLYKKDATKYVYIEGEVTSPGRIEIKNNSTIIELVLRAGANKISGNLEKVSLVRIVNNTPFVKNIDMRHMLETADYKDNMLLEDGDIVFVSKNPLIDWNDTLDSALNIQLISTILNVATTSNTLGIR